MNVKIDGENHIDDLSCPDCACVLYSAYLLNPDIPFPSLFLRETPSLSAKTFGCDYSSDIFHIRDSRSDRKC